MKKLYASLDLGSDTIKLIIGEYFENNLNILAVSNVSSSGIKHGLIVDNDKVQDAIKNAINEIYSMLGFRINEVLVSLPPYNAQYKLLEGSITITNDNQVITENDVTDVLKTAIYNQLDNDMELVTVLPIYYKLDNDLKIKNPIGSSSSKLIAKVVAVVTNKAYFYNLIKTLEAIDVKVIDISFNAIGDYLAVNKPIFDKGLGAFINMGADTTIISIFNRGILMNSEVLKFGGMTIDHDLSYIYKIDRNVSRNIKENFALANTKYAQTNDFYEVDNLDGEHLKLSQFEVSEVVMYRLREMLQITKKALNGLTNKPISYIMFTGGLSEMDGFDLTKDEIFKNSYVGELNTLGIRHNKYISCYGLIQNFHKRMLDRNQEYILIDDKKYEDAIAINKTKIGTSNNESMISRVFGYFFDK